MLISFPKLKDNDQSDSNTSDIIFVFFVRIK